MRTVLNFAAERRETGRVEVSLKIVGLTSAGMEDPAQRPRIKFNAHVESKQLRAYATAFAGLAARLTEMAAADEMSAAKEDDGGN